jgi:hypothetical protein
MVNLYKSLQGLIPRATQIIATVQTEFADGTTACETLTGQVIRVKGDGTRSSGQRVFIEIDPDSGARIVGDAPDLEVFDVEV